MLFLKKGTGSHLWGVGGAPHIKNNIRALENIKIDMWNVFLQLILWGDLSGGLPGPLDKN